MGWWWMGVRRDCRSRRGGAARFAGHGALGYRLSAQALTTLTAHFLKSVSFEIGQVASGVSLLLRRPASKETAIIVPAVLMPDGTIDLSYTNSYLVAAIIAALVSWRTNNLLLTIVVGMASLWLWRLMI